MAYNVYKRMLLQGLSCTHKGLHRFSSMASSAAAITKPESNATGMTVPQLPPFDFKPAPYDGPPAHEILEKRRRFMNPGIILYLCSKCCFTMYAQWIVLCTLTVLAAYKI